MQPLRILLFTAALLLSATVAFSQNTTTWEPLSGPYHRGGSFYDFELKSNGMLFAASVGNGVYRSTNDGKTWVQTIKGLNNLAVFALAVAPNGTLLGVTLGNSVFASTDNGDSWKEHPLATKGDFSARNITVTPAGTWLVATLRGVYRSTDEGVSFTASSTGMTESDKRTSQFAISGNTIYVSGRDRVYHSTDDGKTWTGGANTISGTQANTIFSMAITKSNILYATGLNKTEFVMSTDGGNTWTDAYANLPKDANQQRNDVTAVAADDKGNVYAGLISGGVYRRANVATIWEILPDTLLNNTTILSLSAPPNGIIFAGASGIHRRAADVWEETSGIRYSVVEDVLKRGDKILALANTNLYEYTSDGGTTFSFKPAAIPISNPLNFLKGDAEKSTLFAGTKDSLWYSGDFGKTWTLATYPDGFAAHYRVSDFVVRRGVLALAGRTYSGDSSQLYISTERGLSWSKADIGAEINIHNVEINWDGIWVSSDFGMYYSPDRGTTWQMRNEGLPTGAYISDIAGSANSMYALADGKVFTFESAWREFGNELQHARIQQLFSGDMNDKGSKTFIAAVDDSNRVYANINGPFKPLPQFPFITPAISSIILEIVTPASPQNGDTITYRCIAGTQGMGTYITTPLTISGVSEYRTTNTEVFPDPTRERISIMVKETRGGLGQLEIFDPIGTSVLRLEQEMLAGEAVMGCDVSAFPSGMYGYRLTLPDGVYGGRFVVIR